MIPFLLSPDKTAYQFFVDNNDNQDERVRNIIEANIVRGFFNHQNPRNNVHYLFYEELGIEKYINPTSK